MKKKVLIKTEEFRELDTDNIDLRKIKDIERVDVTDDGVEITFIIK